MPRVYSRTVCALWISTENRGLSDRFSFQKLEEMIEKPWFKAAFRTVLAIKPTGWTHSNKLAALTQIKPTVKGNITSYGMRMALPPGCL